jgi:hypothetical protein
MFDKDAKDIHTLEKSQPLQQMLLGKQAIYMQKTETRRLSLTLCKNQSQMGQRS